MTYIMLIFFCLNQILLAQTSEKWSYYIYSQPKNWKYFESIHSSTENCFKNLDYSSCLKYRKLLISTGQFDGKNSHLYYNFLHLQCRDNIHQLNQISEVSNFLKIPKLNSACVAALQRRMKWLQYRNSNL